MRSIFRHSLLFILSACFLSGCSSLDEPEGIPSFIQIDSIYVSADYASEGSASHRIVDAWVYVDNSLLGVYELPALVPFIGEDASLINVGGGIINNGMIENRSQYAFYERSEDIIDLTSGQTTVYNPTVTYKEVDFVMLDNFDFFTFFQVEPGTVSWSTTSTPSEVLEGARSMRIDLNEVNPIFKMSTSAPYELAPNGRAIYLELNYKAESSFTIGVIPVNNGQMGLDEPVITYIATDQWRKEYVSIGGYINALNADSYHIYISSVLSMEEEDARFFFDNIKLIQF